MRLDVTPAVGTSRARRVHGRSAGADVALLGDLAVEADLLESVCEVVPDARPRAVTADAAGSLAALADLAALDADRPLVVVARGLRLSPVALLDLLDRPGDPTATLLLAPDAAATGEGDAHTTLARVHPERRDLLSTGSAVHTVTAPTGVAAGVLRVRGADRAHAASLWRAAASVRLPSPPEGAPSRGAASGPTASGPAATGSTAAGPVDGFDLALLALVRGGLAVGSIEAGPFDVERGGVLARGAAGSAWQQRLRGASRGGDGFFSTFAVRPLSRRLTGFGLGHDWSPNVVTVCSLLLGLVASALAAVDSYWCWVLAALLLLGALVVDCVDGEIARFTRRFSPLGAWLDAVGDRVKEYSLLAAVAWVGARRGEDLWGVAVAAMGVTTLRHLEDYAYVHRQKASRAHIVPDLLGVDQPRDLGPDTARVTLPEPPSRSATAVFWAKKVLHLPIAERYLLLALALLTFSPAVVLWTMVVAVSLAMVWTLGGRNAKALLRRDGYRPDTGLRPGQLGHLDLQLDLGPVAQLAGRLGRLPLPVLFVAVALLLVVAVLAGTLPPVVVLAAVVVAVLLVGASCRPPVVHLLGWQAPLLLWVAEVAVVMGLSGAQGGVGPAAFAFLAAVAWHRYDVVYRLRDIGTGSAPWVALAGLGVDGRVLALTLLWVAGVPLQPVLGWAALILFLMYAAESARGWRTWVGARSASVAVPTEVLEEPAP